MKKNQSSITAAGISFLRAYEMRKPPEQRLFSDPYARSFIGLPLFYLMKFFVDTGYAEWRGPGIMGFLAARVRYIDDMLLTCMKDGLEQLVILGAGFDARAYRFGELRGRVKVFEVDHPATQQEKLAKLASALGGQLGHVVYVPLDFTVETLAKLFECGYERDRKTLFIWEGVTQYLSPDAVDATLAFVVQNAAPGSTIVFDYMYTSLLDGTVPRGEVSNIQRYRGITGEGFGFGIAKGKVAEFLEQRGFFQVKDTTAEDLKRLYFHEPGQQRTVADGYAIASGVVRGQDK